MSILTFLAVGTGLMLITMAIIAQKFQLKPWKWILITLLLTASGVAGVKLMAFIESGSFNGYSFFGAIFFTPFIMLLIALLLKVPLRDMLDMIAPCECAMLVAMKINCYISGCCYGRHIGIDQYGAYIRFPSQIVEGVNALLICVFLIYLIKNNRIKGKLFFLYMIVYGVSRFLLNLFRDTEAFIWILPAGNFWALLSVLLGSVFYFFLKTGTRQINGVQKGN